MKKIIDNNSGIAAFGVMSVSAIACPKCSPSRMAEQVHIMLAVPVINHYGDRGRHF